MIWMDGLDAPLVMMMEAAFQEAIRTSANRSHATRGHSQTQFGAGGSARWAPHLSGVTRHSCTSHGSETRPALEHFAASTEASVHDGAIMQYTNPVDGRTGDADAGLLRTDAAAG